MRNNEQSLDVSMKRRQTKAEAEEERRDEEERKFRQQNRPTKPGFDWLGPNKLAPVGIPGCSAAFLVYSC